MAFAHRLTDQWHSSILPLPTRRALDYCANATWLKRNGWYLAGGTAMALQGGHRSSVDLDFFTARKEFLEEKVIGHFPKKDWITYILREGTVYGKLLNAKVSFIAYPFFVPAKPYQWYGKIPILDVDDIAVMKIVAISQRGRKRDFVDLYWYCVNKKPLPEIINHLSEQYPEVAHNYAHIMKSLTYFADAEEDPMPKLFFKATWQEIKKYFQREVPKTTKKILRLR